MKPAGDPSCMAPLRATQELVKPISRADKRGFVYMIGVGPDLVKVGRTNNIERRKIEWRRQCPSQDQQWLFYVPTRWSHRLERVVHIHLAAHCEDRPRKICIDCGKRHQEIFSFRRRKNWSGYVKRIIRKYKKIVQSLRR